jgi:capsule polysaccharide export protein KpsE/RkpR
MFWLVGFCSVLAMDRFVVKQIFQVKISGSKSSKSSHCLVFGNSQERTYCISGSKSVTNGRFEK